MISLANITTPWPSPLDHNESLEHCAAGEVMYLWHVIVRKGAAEGGPESGVVRTLTICSLLVVIKVSNLGADLGFCQTRAGKMSLPGFCWDVLHIFTYLYTLIAFASQSWLWGWKHEGEENAACWCVSVILSDAKLAWVHFSCRKDHWNKRDFILTQVYFITLAVHFIRNTCTYVHIHAFIHHVAAGGGCCMRQMCWSEYFRNS